MKELISIGSDHAGFDLKATLIQRLKELGYNPLDQGCFDKQSVHYQEIAKQVCQTIIKAKAKRGILICGTGIGMSITANRFAGIRGTLVHDAVTARMSREHNDSNLLILGARVVSEAVAKDILEIWLETHFEGGRHQDRLNLIEQVSK